MDVRSRPVIFSSAMVSAILNGAKTQTRRVIKPQPVYVDALWPNARSHTTWTDVLDDPTYLIACGYCPYGKPGDHLWIRESFRWGHAPRDEINQGIVMYDDGSTLAHPALLPERRSWARQWRRKPAMYMPRWASRITLEITGVRVERLQDITQGDAVAEGIAWSPGQRSAPILDFAALWDSINGKRGYPWSSNCWVWIVEFRRIQP